MLDSVNGIWRRNSAQYYPSTVLFRPIHFTPMCWGASQRWHKAKIHLEENQDCSDPHKDYSSWTQQHHIIFMEYAVCFDWPKYLLGKISAKHSICSELTFLCSYTCTWSKDKNIPCWSNWESLDFKTGFYCSSRCLFCDASVFWLQRRLGVDTTSKNVESKRTAHWLYHNNFSNGPLVRLDMSLLSMLEVLALQCGGAKATYTYVPVQYLPRVDVVRWIESGDPQPPYLHAQLQLFRLSDCAQGKV